MTAENNLHFLKNKIAEIGSAILYTMSDELIKIPTSIISVLRVDDQGQIWFFVKRPSQIMTDNEKSFPARLQFYRKGKPFYIHVTGYAGISENNETVSEFTSLEKKIEELAMQNLMLIKLRMTNAGYYEQKPSSPENKSIQSIIQNLYSALFKPAVNYRPVELNTELA